MAGTVTLLFTDLVGSTELLGRLGEDGAADLRRRHFAALRDEVQRAGGREVKSLGDGLMVAFESASAAVACAQAMQAGAADHGVGLRVGLHAGEPAHEEDDYFGTPVVVASRLCDRAQAGEILASDLVRGLVGPRGGSAFTALGSLELKGLTEPVAAWSVSWDAHVAAPAPPPVKAPLPVAVARADTAFVGRDGALVQLRAALVSAADSLRIAAVGGEPGIGKTRLAAEFARIAHDDGATVLFGRCDEEALIPYQPFAEAIRTYLADVPAAATGTRGLERLRGAVRPGAEGADPAAERIALFDAVARFVGELGRGGPVVLVLDDLHWADAPTLSLLRHVARAPGTTGLVVATYRESELSRTHPLAAALAELRRERLVERVALTGLSEDDVAALLERAAGHAPPPAFAAALHGETEGNPFFIEEIVRHLIEAGTIVQRDGRWTSDRSIEDMGIPEGVREAVGRRLARLSETANRVLSDASVLGRRFAFDVLTELTGRNEDELLDVLDEALAAQLVVDATEAGRPVYAFRHALVRETLYEELSLPRRQRAHLRAADAIERARSRDLDAEAPALALHLRQAGAAADPRRALDWTLRAAYGYGQALAWEEATSALEAALELMEDAGAEPAERAAVLERLADLRYVTNADLDAGISCLRQALDDYTRAGLTDRAARIHGRLGRDLATYWGPTMDIRRAAEHVQAGLDLIGPDARTLTAAMLEISRATVAVSAVTDQMGLVPAARAVEIARELGRPVVELNARIMEAWGIGAQGDPSALERFEAAWQEADAHNHPWLSFLATWVAMPLVFGLRGMTEFNAWVDRELGKPRSAAAPGQRRLMKNIRAESEALAGRLEIGAAMHDEAPNPGWRLTEAMLASYRHGPEACLAVMDEMIVDAERAGNAWTRWIIGYWGAVAMLGTPDVDGALDRYAAAARIVAGEGPGFAAVEHVRFIPWFAIAGRAGEARRLLADAERIFTDERLAVPVARLPAARAALGDGEIDDAFGTAAARLDACGNYFDAAELRRAWGLLAGREEPIDEAIAMYERAGAADAWVEVARGERERAATRAHG